MNRSGALAQSPSIDIANLDVKRNGSLYMSGGNSTVPVWVPDHEASHCMVCDKKFSIKGKHHCRSCGFVVCNSCSSARIQLPHTSGRVRCCDRCVKDMQSKPIAMPTTTLASPNPLNASIASSPTPQSPTSLSSSSAALASSTANTATVLPSSPNVTSPPQPNNIKQWKQQIEKENEMVAIFEGQSNGYTSLTDLYQSPEYVTAPIAGEVIPHDFTGVGADVPDWAYMFTTPDKQQARIGRLRLKLLEFDSLVLNNISILPQTDPNNTIPFKVENATISAFIALGNTFHQTSPVDIGVVSQHETTTGPIRSARGLAKVNQGCVLDISSVTQSLRVQIVINKLTPSRTIDGYSIPEQNLAIPIGFLNIPISSLKRNRVESLALQLTPTTPQQIAALTQTPAYLRKSNTTASAPTQQNSTTTGKQPQRATIKVEVECICSDIGYLWSNFDTSQVYNEATTPPLSLYNIVQYSLLVLNAFRPLLTSAFEMLQISTWRSPLYTLLFLFVVLFETCYPIPMMLIIFHIAVLRLLLSPLLSPPSPATSSKSTVEKDNFISTELTPSSLHQLSQLTPDSEATLAQQQPSEADSFFVELFVEFLDKLLPLLYPTTTTNTVSSQLVPTQPSPNSSPYNTETFSFSSLTSFYNSIHSFYAIFVTPFSNLISWQTSLASSVLAVTFTLVSLVLLFFLPSHYIYISIGLLPFLYHSAPLRLLRAFK